MNIPLLFLVIAQGFLWRFLFKWKKSHDLIIWPHLKQTWDMEDAFFTAFITGFMSFFATGALFLVVILFQEVFGINWFIEFKGKSDALQ